MSDKRILAVIPARFASERFPGKMLMPLAGKTLLQCCYDNAAASSVFHRILVATDDKRIFDHVHDFGGEAVMTSVDCPTGTDRIAEAVAADGSLSAYPIVVNIQGDEPMLAASTIRALCDALVDDDSAVMSTAAVRVAADAHACNDADVVKVVVDGQGCALYFSRSRIPGHRQCDSASSVLCHLGVYAFRRDFLLRYASLPSTPLQRAENLEQLKVLEHGYRIQVAVVEDSSIGVDNADDLATVERILCRQNISSSPAVSSHR